MRKMWASPGFAKGRVSFSVRSIRNRPTWPPVHVFTPDELKEHDREVALRAWVFAQGPLSGKDFETYWRERMKGDK